jgi:uncharacterized membrane protein (DUF2068 family)
VTQHPGSSPFGLRLIGGFKVASSLLLMALGVGLVRSIHGDLNDLMYRLLGWIKLDPDNHYIHGVIERVSGIKPSQLREIGAGTILYGLLYGVEGTGLLLRKPWAEYLTVVMTGLLIPLEVYEVFKKPTASKVLVLALNIAIVVYLVIVVRNRKREERAGRANSAAS